MTFTDAELKQLQNAMLWIKYAQEHIGDYDKQAGAMLSLAGSFKPGETEALEQKIGAMLYTRWKEQGGEER